MSAAQQPSFGSIVLIDDHLRALYQQALLNETTSLLGVSFLSLSAWMKQLTKEAPREEELLFSCRRRLKEHEEQLAIFQAQLDDAAFLKQCSAFMQELRLYGVSVNTLPQRSDSEKELKRILSLCHAFPAPIDAKLEALAAVRAMTDASHIYIYPSFFSLYEQQIVDLLIERGAHLLHWQLPAQTPRLYYAVNMRQEIEGIAQLIIQEDWQAEEIALCVCDPFYEALAVQIFTRYQIPHTLIHTDDQDDLSRQMQAWLRFAADPKAQSLEALLTSGAFACESDALLQYTKLFHCDMLQPICARVTQQTPGVLFDQFTLAQLEALEQKAIRQQADILPWLKQALSCTPTQLFSFLCDFFAQRYPSPDTRQLRCMKQLQQLFRDVHTHVNAQADLAFLASLLDDQHSTWGNEHLEGVLIHTPKEIFYERPIRFLCGAAMNAWPHFTAKSGIFDERYCETLALPSMEQRYQHHLAQCDKLYHAQQLLIVTYPLGTYEGKSHEASLEIEQYMERRHVSARPLPLASTHAHLRPAHSLDETLAHQLYLQEGELRGSISAFERYRLCPFSYFLRYGLRLKKQKSDVGQAQIGSLIHALLQELCEEYGKDYVKTQSAELAKRIQAKLSPLAAMYPHQQKYILQLQKRLTRQLEVLFDTLSSLEEHSHLHIGAQEQPFHYTLPLTNAALHMSGVIDRIDVTNHIALILDYKSSRKTLSSSKVYSGLQLQLLTYALALANGQVAGFEEVKEVLGAFYISTKTESIAQPAMKINRQKKECRECEAEDMRGELQKKKRLSGWIFSENINLFDDDASHVANLKLADGKVVGRDKNTIRSLPAIMDALTKILTYLGESILQGEIACEPGEGACDFCDFHSVCRYRGQPFTKAAIVDAQSGESCLPLPKDSERKEESDDASME